MVKSKEIPVGTESCSQADVLIFMDKYPDVYFTTEQIRKALNVQNREKIAKFLRKLLKFNFVERKRVRGVNELLYKLKDIKEPGKEDGQA